MDKNCFIILLALYSINSEQVIHIKLYTRIHCQKSKKSAETKMRQKVAQPHDVLKTTGHDSVHIKLAKKCNCGIIIKIRSVFSVTDLNKLMTRVTSTNYPTPYVISEYLTKNCSGEQKAPDKHRSFVSRTHTATTLLRQ